MIGTAFHQRPMQFIPGFTRLDGATQLADGLENTFPQLGRRRFGKGHHQDPVHRQGCAKAAFRRPVSEQQAQI